MNEFRVVLDQVSSRNRDRKIRLVAWGSVLLLVIVSALGVWAAILDSARAHAILTAFAVQIVAGAIVGAYVLGMYLSLERSKRDLVFVLTESGLVRRRSGWPDVQIGFSEIKALHDRRSSLVVESVDPDRRIAIPKDVDRFDSLRAELAKHGPIIVASRPSRFALPLRLLPTVASLVCWGVLLWSRDSTLEIVAGAAVLTLLLWSSFHLGKSTRRDPERNYVWAMISLGWLGAILLIYFRFARTR